MTAYQKLKQGRYETVHFISPKAEILNLGWDQNIHIVYRLGVFTAAM